MMELIVSSSRGTLDLSRLFVSAQWAGSKKSCARTLVVTLPASYGDPHLPKMDVQLGDHAVFRENGSVLLDGFVSQISETTGMGTRSVTIHDRGLQLNRNQAAYKFLNAAPEEIVRRVARDFGIAVGDLPGTGNFRLSRNFVGVSLYKIIATAYSKASSSTGVQYSIRFVGDKLCVRELQRRATTPLLRPGSNLISASATRDIENLVNRVVILDKTGAELKRLEDSESQSGFGLSQATLKDSDNARAEAQKMLSEGKDPRYQISVEGLGDTRFVSGETAAVQDKATGLWGIFAIDADTHTWQAGRYTVKLTLTLKNRMETVDAGSEVE